jgi:hypothetical protein
MAAQASDETFVTALRDAMGANEIFATDPRHPVRRPKA